MSAFVTLPPWLLEQALPLIPPEVRLAMRSYGLVLAGGFMRAVAEGRQPKDVDLFHWNANVIAQAAQALASVRYVRPKPYQSRVRLKVDGAAGTNYAVPGTPPLDLVGQSELTPATGSDLLTQVLRSFDLSVASAGLFESNGGISGLCHPLFVSDVAARRVTVVLDLRSDEHLNPGTVFMRLLSHASKGYTIPAEALEQVTTAILQRARCNPQAVRQLVGVASDLKRRADATTTS